VNGALSQLALKRYPNQSIKHSTSETTSHSASEEIALLPHVHRKFGTAHLQTLTQNWRIFLRAGAQMVYKFRKNFFASPWEV